MTRTDRARRKSWGIGDIFSIRLEDGTYVLGQVVAAEPQALNSVAVVLFDIRVSDDANGPIESCRRELVFSIIITTRDLLDSGDWRVIANILPVIAASESPYEATRAHGFVGARIVGSGNVRKFANAFFGMHPWNAMKDPDYFAKLLTSTTSKPRFLLYV